MTTTPAVVHQMWIWLKTNGHFNGLNPAELDDMPTREIVQAVDAVYPGGSDRFFADHPEVSAEDPATYLDYLEATRAAGQVAR